MAPTKLVSKIGVLSENTNGFLPHGITTRSKNGTNNLKTYKESLKIPGKRKANSPLKDVTAKRAAFGDITNAISKITSQEKDNTLVIKKVTVQAKVLPAPKNIKNQISENFPINGKTVTNNSKGPKARQMNKASTLETIHKNFLKENLKTIPGLQKSQNNNTLKNTEKQEQHSTQSHGSAKSGRSIDESSEPSLYVSALENIPSDINKSITENLDKVVLEATNLSILDEEKDIPHFVPAGVADFDKENWDDPLQVSHYAMDIFNYLKSRESLFPIDDYMPRQKGLTNWMRALLVDWMVEVQESFELNHETLYLAVKLVDLYLCKSTAAKEQLQLLGAASLFIASKFDERVPPLVDDFLYICDGAYTLNELLSMEMGILKVIDFKLGIPLSYRFLRRYARCARVSMPTLTLARYVLELCLLEYSVVSLSDSKMAAAALYIAIRMKSVSGWTSTLEYYTGYKLQDILPIALLQNSCIRKKPKDAISTVRNKYSHKIFFEVAKVPLIEDSVLLS